MKERILIRTGIWLKSVTGGISDVPDRANRKDIYLVKSFLPVKNFCVQK